jgi:hypothetical protein
MQRGRAATDVGRDRIASIGTRTQRELDELASDDERPDKVRVGAAKFLRARDQEPKTARFSQ